MSRAAPPLSADPAILAIPIRERGEALVDVALRGDVVLAAAHALERGPASGHTLVRRAVYRRLLLARRALPADVRIRLREGWRSLRQQRELFDACVARIARQHPDWPSSRCFREATRIVAPVINADGSPNVPPHSTGAAVDVDLIDSSGQALDMGTAFDDAGDPERARTDCPDIARQARRHRRLLVDAMAAQGFVNYPYEWWHFSYGDRYWAFVAGQAAAIYGPVEPSRGA